MTICISDLYKEGHSIKSIASIKGWGYEKTRRALKANGITLRSVPEGVSLSKRQRPIESSEKLIELIDGLLLSDASIEFNKWSGRLCISQTITHVDWLDNIQNELERIGIKCSRISVPPKEVIIKGKVCKRKESVVLRTLSYDYFLNQGKRWYQDGVKIVPSDVRLTGKSIANWYFGDGGVGNNGYHATFSTDSFSEHDVRFLIDSLNSKFDFGAIPEQRNRILIGTFNGRCTLHSLISSYVPNSFAYKLNLKLRSKTIDKNTIDRIINLRKENLSYDRISTLTSVSKTKTASICAEHGLAGKLAGRIR